ncbi:MULTISPECIES: lysozyme [spotted fever group]|uniref:lysozyme n=1 Tax=spotted fever group TaxID=114277 RepID=UPI00059BEEAB|nr:MULTISPECIES: lysozyme [spotted fever group]
MNRNQKAALISFIFNCGAGAFQASTLRQKLNRGEYANAANELLRWMRAKGGLKLQGLVKRRQYYRL